MKNKLYLIIAVVYLIGASTASKAQTTGSFNDTISFMSNSRQLSCYVPPTYNPAVPAKLMIGLHGLGDNSNNYRNALINTLGFQSIFNNTIFICPDGGSDPTKDFYTPAGDEAIIAASVSYATSHYNIDTMQIILQGFSLGGRSALRYGLDNPVKFKGLLLNTPAIQGTKEAVSLLYNYGSGPNIPIYITHGDNVVLYSSPIDSVIESLIINDARVKLNRVTGLAHAIPAFSQMPDVASFFNSQTSLPLDAEIYRLIMNDRSCNSLHTINCLVRNTGSQPITSIHLSYSFNGNTNNYTWNGNLASYEHAIIPLPSANANPGFQNISVTVLDVNGQPDTLSANNTATAGFEYVQTPMNLPYTEGFEGSMAGLLIHTSGDVINLWELDNTVSKTGQNSMFSFNTALVFNNKGRSEDLVTPVLDLTSMSQPIVSFDVAHNYHKFTAPYVVDSLILADTLEVAVSGDCGDNYQVLYRKAGSQLATFPAPILNPINIQLSWQNPSAANWRHEQISLAQFSNSGDVVVKIRYISGNGGFINLDNIVVSSAAAVNNLEENKSLKLYPNPSNLEAKIEAPFDIIGIRLIDITGKVIGKYLSQGGKTFLINTANMTDGLYTVIIEGSEGVRTSKLQVKH
jgi:pimeloyl-ACP methyl ester carboxylesterase